MSVSHGLARGPDYLDLPGALLCSQCKATLVEQYQDAIRALDQQAGHEMLVMAAGPFGALLLGAMTLAPGRSFLWMPGPEGDPLRPSQFTGWTNLREHQDVVLLPEGSHRHRGSEMLLDLNMGAKAMGLRVVGLVEAEMERT